MKFLILTLLKECEKQGIPYELDSDGFYIDPINNKHACAFINMIDEDEQEWIRLVITFDDYYYRCDIEPDEINSIKDKMSYWLSGEYTHENLRNWCTFYAD